MSRRHTDDCTFVTAGTLCDCKDTCATCAGDDECVVHHTYRCATCKQRRPWSDGAADDMPDSCDACWAMANYDRYANDVRIGETLARRA